MNAVYGGKIKTFQPKIHYEDNGVTFIRPFIYVREKQVVSQCKKDAIAIVKSNCPNDGCTQRSHMKNALETIYEQFPSAKRNFLKMLQDEEVKLWKKENE